jgi:hypothetical protein
VEGRQAGHLNALCAAASFGQLEVARLLLEGGADPSRADSNGDTALMAAALDGHLPILQLLLEWGVAMDAKRPDGTTAFHYACLTNQPDCAEALIREK